MNSRLRRVSLIVPVVTLLTALLLLPAPAQEQAPPPAPPPASPPASTPASPPPEAKVPPKDASAPTVEEDAPPDLGENVSADNNVSFPVDI